MSDEDAPDPIRKLAAEYVDIWEQQMRGLAKDEALADAMAQTLQLMNAGAAGVAAMMQGYAGGAQGAADAAKDGQSGAHSSTQAAAPAPGDADPDVRDVARRLAELEERLARLEGLVAQKGKRPKRKPE